MSYLQISSTQDPNDEADVKAAERILGIGGGLLIFLLVLILLWVLAGLSAFIASIVCMFMSGTAIEKVLGFVLALIVGPFYWIYFFMMKSYCKTEARLAKYHAKKR